LICINNQESIQFKKGKAMKAAVLYELNQPVVVEDIEILYLWVLQ